MNQSFFSEVSAYADRFPAEASLLSLLQHQIAEGDDVSSRKCTPGHLTASALVVSLCGTKVLLIHHNIFRRWLQPGGHLEAGDTSLLGAALRECLEETGVAATPHPWTKATGIALDFDSHRIAASASKAEPEHFHHDFMILLEADAAQPLVAQLAEVSGAAWRPIADLASDNNARLHRALGKLSAISALASPKGALPRPLASHPTPAQANGQPWFVDDYDEAGLKDAQQRLQDLINTGIPFGMPEAEVRALGEQYSTLLLDAKEAMQMRGIGHADFPAMFNALLREFDALRFARVASDPT